jgi:hypothetical protein
MPNSYFVSEASISRKRRAPVVLVPNLFADACSATGASGASAASEALAVSGAFASSVGSTQPNRTEEPMRISARFFIGSSAFDAFTTEGACDEEALVVVDREI